MELVVISLMLWQVSVGVKYPNEIVDPPLVLCEPERIVIKIKTSSSNPSHIYADDFADDPDCSSRNMNKVALRHGKCGMSTERTDNPSGVIQRVCISVQLHPLFVTESDRNYCAQCVYVQSQVLDDFESTLDISESLPTELAPQFDVQKMPKCSYTIRKGSESGPEVRFASVGESVYHVWRCPGENFGILVQNCFVEDGQGDRILVIDQNGCGVDQYIMPTPEYSEDLTTAFQETHVFKFARKTVTRFICQIRICLQSDECKKLTVSRSNSVDEGVQEFPDDVRPPASKPENDFKQNTTIGSIYFGYGYDSPRNRRELSEARFTTSKGYPEVDLVGELRVLDSPEDVMYFESKSSETSSKCVTPLHYSLMIAALVVVSVLLAIVILLLFSMSSSKSKVVRFEN
ncbi:unnamed protein product [Haemonchus placei]|uniref:ZP domain-containing protein n=1 Tax=Haemonchus placei TaxID=6290 RepID=A0A0N4WBL3_HAEPC|nr:unnamed protein product [Haemonchus placei]